MEPRTASARGPSAVDEDWNPSWPTDWQRHYAALREQVRNEEDPAQVLPGFTMHGTDVGKWLTGQREPGGWAALADGQRECLEAVATEPSTAPVSAFVRGIVALFERDFDATRSAVSFQDRHHG
ncbi:helicase associated domain-containing protein [Streptomyces sp. NPDC052077]|uniref:helicase associated domain-containing protein n=1 Tax=Streptomyces sp. NPDC052077 TaxID=3154757 RepID=UPI0034453CE7